MARKNPVGCRTGCIYDVESFAVNPAALCAPSQNGRCAECPHRQRTKSPRSPTSNSRPSASINLAGPVTRYGPFLRTLMVTGSGMLCLTVGLLILDGVDAFAAGGDFAFQAGDFVRFICLLPCGGQELLEFSDLFPLDVQLFFLLFVQTHWRCFRRKVLPRSCAPGDHCFLIQRTAHAFDSNTRTDQPPHRLDQVGLHTPSSHAGATGGLSASARCVPADYTVG